MDQGLDSFHKTTEKDDEIPLDLSYLTEEENCQYDLPEILSQLAIPTEGNIQYKLCLYSPLKMFPQKL